MSGRRAAVLVVTVVGLLQWGAGDADASMKWLPSWAPKLGKVAPVAMGPPQIKIFAGHGIPGRELQCWYDTGRYVGGRYVWWCYNEYSTLVGPLDRADSTTWFLKRDDLTVTCQYRLMRKRNIVDSPDRYSSVWDAVIYCLKPDGQWGQALEVTITW